VAEPLVARWWHHDTSAEAVDRDFGPSIDGADVTELFRVALASRPIGLVQRYPIAAYRSTSTSSPRSARYRLRR